MSRIGKKPVELPKGVSASISGQTIEVKGPKGTRTFTAGDDVTITIDGTTVKVTPRARRSGRVSSGAWCGPWWPTLSPA